MKAELILENGMRFSGELFGAEKDVVGEVVFSTGMVGYQELLTNPASKGQIAVMTFPMIGNYGANTSDMEADNAAMTAIVVREKCDCPSNFRCEKTLEQFMKEEGVVGLCGVDTRALTRVLRDFGTMKGAIVSGEDKDIMSKISSFDNSKAVLNVTAKEKYEYSKGDGARVAVIDLGVKRSTLAQIASKDAGVTVFPANARAEEILSVKPDVVFFSAGPGSPFDATDAMVAAKELLGKVKLVGTALGHMVIALALGCKVEKLKFGHHGSNYPVKSLSDGKVLITSQNNCYSITELAQGVTETYRNVNDGTVAGFKAENAAGVLFDICGGEKDFQDGYILDEFLRKGDK